MKTSNLKRTICAFLLLSVSTFSYATTHKGEETNANKFYYDCSKSTPSNPTQTVYKSDNTGKYLTPHIQYKFNYDEQQRVISKEAFRWNPIEKEWEQSFRLNFTYDENSVTAEYAAWNKQTQTYNLQAEKAIYRIDSDKLMSYGHYKKKQTDNGWVLIASWSDEIINPFLINNYPLLANSK